MDSSIKDIKKIQSDARCGKLKTRPVWPMIILKTPKGWTCPKIVDGKQIEGSFRAHQVPVTIDSEENFKILENWLKSYKPDELFDENYKLKKEIKDILPKGNRRISANPVTYGGIKQKLVLPNVLDYALDIEKPGEIKAQDMMELGKYIRDIFELNKDNKNFRLFCPDEALSNRLNHIFEKENRDFNAEIISSDEYLSNSGRIMDSFLSEHACEGWLEGYLLTGRYGVFASYEAFVRVVDSMVSQHAKWLKVSKGLSWRKPIPSLNLLLTSNVWQQDHNGYTHQEPGILDHVINKKSDITNIFLPPDTNCLLNCFEKAVSSENKINVIVASKHPSFQWLDAKSAKEHCEKGVSVWKWASDNDGKNPDIILASAGDTATIEALATAKLLKQYLPEVKVRFVNVVDLMKLSSDKEYKDRLSDKDFDEIFTKNKPILFNFHGYPKLIRELFFGRNNHNLDVHGYMEEGSITTAFDMRVQNKIDRYHLLLSAIEKLGLREEKKDVVIEINKLLDKHVKYISKNGEDMPEIADWKWES